MNIQIDAKGKQCPLPVIEAKNAISGMTEAGIVEVTVDNEIAVQNLTQNGRPQRVKSKEREKIRSGIHGMDGSDRRVCEK